MLPRSAIVSTQYSVFQFCDKYWLYTPKFALIKNEHIITGKLVVVEKNEHHVAVN